MLDVAAHNLRDEIEHALRYQSELIDGMCLRISRYVGDAHHSRHAPEDSAKIYENHAFEFIALTQPNLIFSNPRVTLGMVGPDTGDDLSADEIGINHILRDTDFEETAASVCLDMFFGFGVFMIGLETVPGYEDRPHPRPLRPRVWRLSPRRYFCDVRNMEHPRFEGHVWVKDKEDLEAVKDQAGNPVYDPEVLAQCTTGDGLKEAGQAQPNDAPDRGEIVGYEVYVPETRMIYCIGFSACGDGSYKAGYLRAPRRWIGSRRGPYRRVGIYGVPDDPYPLAPLGASQNDVEEINRHARQASADADQAKRLVFINSDQKKLKSAVVHGTGGTVWAIPGFDPSMIHTVDFQGPMPASLEYLSLARERLDRKSGINETKRGNIAQDNTATAEAIAERAGDIRTKGMQRPFRKAVVSAIREMLCLMRKYDHVSFPVTSTDEETGVKTGGVYVGGGADKNGDDDTIMVEIEPHSMEFVNQAVLQQRVREGMELAITVTQAAMVNPAIKARNILNDWGQANNIKDAGSRYVDFQILEQLQLAQTLSQTSPGGPMGPPAPDGAAGPNGTPSRAPGPNSEGVGEVDPIAEEAARLRGAQVPALA